MFPYLKRFLPIYFLLMLSIASCRNQNERSYYFEPIQQQGVYPGFRCGFTTYNPGEQDWDYILLWTNSWDAHRQRDWVYIELKDDSLRNLWPSIHTEWPVDYMKSMDVTGDGQNELLVTFSNDTLAGVKVYRWENPGFEPVSTFVLNRNKPPWNDYPVWDGQLFPVMEAVIQHVQAFIPAESREIVAIIRETAQGVVQECNE